MGKFYECLDQRVFWRILFQQRVAYGRYRVGLTATFGYGRLCVGPLYVSRSAPPFLLLFSWIDGSATAGYRASVFQMKILVYSIRWGMLIVYVAFGMPFAVFILTGFFKSLPSGLHESALIDGAGEFRAFWSIMLPLARPGLITVGIFSFLNTWNEFFMAFMFLSGEGSQHLRTLPLG